MPHTILFIQSGPNPDTRTFTDFKTVRECIEGLCKIYEEHLKRRNPEVQVITYDVSQIFEFVDLLTDVGCLVYQESQGLYAPYNKEWIKDKIYSLLKQEAEGSGADL